MEGEVIGVGVGVCACPGDASPNMIWRMAAARSAGSSAGSSIGISMGSPQ